MVVLYISTTVTILSIVVIPYDMEENDVQSFIVIFINRNYYHVTTYRYGFPNL